MLSRSSDRDPWQVARGSSCACDYLGRWCHTLPDAEVCPRDSLFVIEFTFAGDVTHTNRPPRPAYIVHAIPSAARRGALATLALRTPRHNTRTRAVRRAACEGSRRRYERGDLHAQRDGRELGRQLAGAVGARRVRTRVDQREGDVAPVEDAGEMQRQVALPVGVVRVRLVREELLAQEGISLLDALAEGLVRLRRHRSGKLSEAGAAEDVPIRVAPLGALLTRRCGRRAAG
mmetsp:Transcript_19649/g.64999  ORF Transcript_19649/g.64999 Transcript_19649/m.64999 type:complete len:232 (-) Transcript_19649:359-1054(-)